MEAGSPDNPDAIAAAVEPLVSHPARSAVFCDIDGTISPIVERSHDAFVPAPQRRLLGRLADRYALVGCVSGRAASEARRLVGIGGLAYIGNHGYERMLPGGAGVELDPAVAPHASAAADFVAALDPRLLRSVKLRIEEKGPITALHWRGTPDEAAAEARAQEIASDAEDSGLVAHRGRKVLELRPPVDLTKGTALAALLDESAVDHALYGGDDRTDLDAFRSLEALRSRGALETIVRVGVTSAEGPEEIATEADLVVSGTEGFTAVLAALAGEG